MFRMRFYAIGMFVLCMLCQLGGTVFGQSPEEIEQFTKNREERVSWWRDARYGMFIHWGVYADLAGEWQGKRVDGPGEWIMYHGKIPVEAYENVARQFNPVQFDADQWVKIAKDAGMKYIVITAKHCDGFAMYDSDVTDYNITDYTPFKRDPIMELRKACDKYGLKLGFYYSHNWDWHEPNAIGFDNTWDFPDREKKNPEIYYKEKSIPQIKELVEKYSPEIMWFDVPTDISKETSFEILKLIREIKPDCIINDRISSEHKEKKLLMGDFYTPEQYIPKNLNMDFETCMTLNGTWGFKYYDLDWKSPEIIVQNLIKNVSMGGNYLLNVGPDGLGNIPSNSVLLLKTAGKWLAENGESIYGTTSSPLKHVFYGKAASTAKPGKVFIHLFEWPETSEFVLAEFNAKADRIYFLSDKNKEPLLFKQNESNDIRIDLAPAQLSPNILNPLVNTLVIEYKGELSPQKLPVLVDPFNTAVFTPENARLSGNASYGFNNRWGENRGYEMKTWNAGGALEWDIRTVKNGTYKLELVYGANELSEDCDIHVNIHNQSFKHKILDFSGWYKPIVVDLGEITIEKEHSGTLKVLAGYSLANTIANFMEVRLIPVRKL